MTFRRKYLPSINTLSCSKAQPVLENSLETLLPCTESLKRDKIKLKTICL